MKRKISSIAKWCLLPATCPPLSTQSGVPVVCSPSPHTTTAIITNDAIQGGAKGRGKKKEKDEPKIKKDFDPDEPDKPYGCECKWNAKFKEEKKKSIRMIRNVVPKNNFVCLLKFASFR